MAFTDFRPPMFWTVFDTYAKHRGMEWEILYFNDDVQRAILGFAPGMQARYVHLTARMIEFGSNLGMPHTRAMGKGLFELRMKAKEGIGRVFFCCLHGQRIMMLHAFVKKSAKTLAKELKIARARLKEALTNDDTRRNGQESAEAASGTCGIRRPGGGVRLAG